MVPISSKIPKNQGLNKLMTKEKIEGEYSW